MKKIALALALAAASTTHAAPNAPTKMTVCVNASSGALTARSRCTRSEFPASAGFLATIVSPINPATCVTRKNTATFPAGVIVGQNCAERELLVTHGIDVANQDLSVFVNEIQLVNLTAPWPQGVTYTMVRLPGFSGDVTATVSAVCCSH